jgi:hypothetical protein
MLVLNTTLDFSTVYKITVLYLCSLLLNLIGSTKTKYENNAYNINHNNIILTKIEKLPTKFCVLTSSLIFLHKISFKF